MGPNGNIPCTISATPTNYIDTHTNYIHTHTSYMHTLTNYMHTQTICTHSQTNTRTPPHYLNTHKPTRGGHLENPQLLRLTSHI